MKDIIVIAIIAVIILAAVIYVVRSRKKGRKCIGCPSGGECGSCDISCGQNSSQQSVARREVVSSKGRPFYFKNQRPLYDENSGLVLFS